MNPYSLAFLLALLVATGLRLWLAVRQLSHVRRHRQQVPERFRARISAQDHERAADYTCAKVRLGIIHSLIEALLVLAFTLGGGLEAISTAATAALGAGLAAGVLTIASVGAISAVADLPLSIWQTFVTEARFGFNKTTPRLFVLDLLRNLALACAMGSPLILAALWMMSALGAAWWLWAWLGWMAFNLLLLAIFPTWIAPLFNTFSPLPEGPLRGRVETLLARCGFEARGLFVVDGSRRSSHGNAYFTGFGRSKRVVFFDTLLESLDPAEVEAVLAHELGHFRRGHIRKRIVMVFLASFVLLALLGYLLTQPAFFHGLGVATPGVATGLALFFLVLPILTFPVQPLMSLYSRRHEFEADEYASVHAAAPDLITALVKLYQDNASTLTPDPWHSAFYDSHPPAAVRIARLESLAAH